MKMDNVREKGKPRCKISYKVFKEQDGYYQLLDIYTFTTLIQLGYFFDDTQHCATFVGKWIFDSNVSFEIFFTRDDMDYY